MATIAAASRKPLRAAGASARAGAGWVDTFAVRTEPFIGKCLSLSANAAGEQFRGTTRPPRGTSRPDCGIMERNAGEWPAAARSPPGPPHSITSLPTYPIGHLIALQLEEKLPREVCSCSTVSRTARH